MASCRNLRAHRAAKPSGGRSDATLSTRKTPIAHGYIWRDTQPGSPRKVRRNPTHDLVSAWSRGEFA